jgi:hypothetical protein
MAESYMQLLNNQQQVSKDVYAQIDRAMSESLASQARASQFETEMVAKAADFGEQIRMNDAQIQSNRDRNFLDYKRYEAESALQPLKVRNELLETKLREREIAQSIERDSQDKFNKIIASVDGRFANAILNSPNPTLADKYLKTKSQWYGDAIRSGVINEDRYNSQLESLIEESGKDQFDTSNGRNDQLFNTLQAINPVVAAEYKKNNPYTRQEIAGLGPVLLNAKDDEFNAVMARSGGLMDQQMKSSLIADRVKLDTLREKLSSQNKTASIAQARLVGNKNDNPEDYQFASSLVSQAKETEREIQALLQKRASGDWSAIVEPTPTKEPVSSMFFNGEKIPVSPIKAEDSSSLMNEISESKDKKGLAIDALGKRHGLAVSQIAGRDGSIIDVSPMYDKMLETHGKDAADRYKARVMDAQVKNPDANKSIGDLFGFKETKNGNPEEEKALRAKIDRLEVVRDSFYPSITEGIDLKKLGYEGKVTNDLKNKIHAAVRDNLKKEDPRDILDSLDDSQVNKAIANISVAVNPRDKGLNFGGGEETFIGNAWDALTQTKTKVRTAEGLREAIKNASGGDEAVFDVYADLVTASFVNALRDNN